MTVKRKGERKRKREREVEKSEERETQRESEIKAELLEDHFHIFSGLDIGTCRSYIVLF